jgi:hypothetical protein
MQHIRLMYQHHITKSHAKKIRKTFCIKQPSNNKMAPFKTLSCKTGKAGILVNKYLFHDLTSMSNNSLPIITDLLANCNQTTGSRNFKSHAE